MIRLYTLLVTEYGVETFIGQTEDGKADLSDERSRAVWKSIYWTEGRF